MAKKKKTTKKAPKRSACSLELSRRAKAQTRSKKTGRFR